MMEVDRRNEAMEELVRGREFANQLGQVMKNSNDELAATTLFAQHLVLVNNVLNSFTNTLSLLKLQTEDFSFITSTKSQENSQEYKRRKITKTWEKVSQSPTTDDGHEWRKYGQKTIINSKYSREYYRCTHKVDQRCQATKQVQRIQEKPPSYTTTYYDHHTCKSTNEIIFEPTSPHDPSILLSFNNTFPTPTKQDCPFLSSHDCKEELVIPSPSLDDYLLSPEPTLDNSISTSQVNSSTSALSSTFESDDDDHNDIMMMYGDLLYHSAELHHDFFHPFLGYIGDQSTFAYV